MSEMVETSTSFHDQLVCEDSDPPLAVSVIRAMLDAALVILEGNGWSYRQLSPDRWAKQC